MTTTSKTETGTELTELVSHYVILSAGRKALRGNCPFHPDTTQAFMVSAEKQLFKCFGCGKEGGIREFQAAVANLTRA